MTTTTTEVDNVQAAAADPARRFQALRELRLNLMWISYILLSVTALVLVFRGADPTVVGELGTSLAQGQIVIDEQAAKPE